MKPLVSINEGDIRIDEDDFMNVHFAPVGVKRETRMVVGGVRYR